MEDAEVGGATRGSATLVTSAVSGHTLYGCGRSVRVDDAVDSSLIGGTVPEEGLS